MKAKKTPSRRVTLGANRGSDSAECIDALRAMNVTPHVAPKKHTTLDGRTTGRPGFSISQRLRKRIEEIFGWMKTVGGIRKTRYRGLEKVRLAFTLTAIAYNLLRIAKLAPA